MPTLYDAYLPVVQDLNTYGGNFAANLIYRRILDAVDTAAVAGDLSLVELRRELASKIDGFKGLHDTESISALFEVYYEAVLYLVAKHRMVPVRRVPAGSKHGKTPDFATVAESAVGFEVKTIDVFDPAQTYRKAMSEGLDAHLEAEAVAKAGGGIGSAARAIPQCTDRQKIGERWSSK